MTPINDERNAASREAVRWLIALQEEPEDSALRARFEKWRDASADNAEAWISASRTYHLVGQAKPAHSEHWKPYVAERAAAQLAPSGERPQFGAAPAGGRGRGRRVSVYLSVGFVMLCCAYVLSPRFALWLSADHMTATTELRIVRLDDGSIVNLSAQSAIKIEFEEKERRVSLLAGEAFFEVSPDPVRPFRVTAGKASSTVIGTAFNVRIGQKTNEVAVRNGVVSVAYSGGLVPERLEGGNWVRLHEDQISRGEVPPEQVATWLRGQLIAQNRLVSDVVDELRRYFSGMIILSDAQIGHRRLTGVYNLIDPFAALSAIAAAHGYQVHRLSPWILVVARR